VIVNTDDLVTITEIAKRAGVTSAAVSNWIARYAKDPMCQGCHHCPTPFPAKVVGSSRGGVYLWPQVADWLTTTGKGNHMMVKCPECGRIFDLNDGTDAGEWAYGHDCEAS
jgi:hypothetical protein